MKVKVIKRKSISEMVEIKREKSLEELVEENDKMIKKLDDQFNNILAEIKIVNRILKDKIERQNEQD